MFFIRTCRKTWFAWHQDHRNVWMDQNSITTIISWYLYAANYFHPFKLNHILWYLHNGNYTIILRTINALQFLPKNSNVFHCLLNKVIKSLALSLWTSDCRCQARQHVKILYKSYIQIFFILNGCEWSLNVGTSYNTFLSRCPPSRWFVHILLMQIQYIDFYALFNYVHTYCMRCVISMRKR